MRDTKQSVKTYPDVYVEYVSVCVSVMCVCCVCVCERERAGERESERIDAAACPPEEDHQSRRRGGVYKIFHYTIFILIFFSLLPIHNVSGESDSYRTQI